MLLKKFGLLAIILLVSCGQIDKGQDMANDNLIPRKILFGNPEKIQVRLSPDGKYMSYLAPLDGVMNIYVMPVDNISAAKPVTSDKGRGIRSYSWTYLTNKLIYSQDTDGDENTIVYLVNLDSMETKAITPKGAKSYVINLTKDHPEEALISINERNPEYFDVYKLNLATLKSELVYENNQYTNFIVNDDNSIKFGIKIIKDVGDEQIDEFLDLQGKEVKHFKTIAFEDTSNSNPLHINKSGTKLFMLDSKNKDKGALIEIDLKTGESRVIAESDKADISEIILDPKTYEIQAYSYTYDRSVTKIIDPAIKEDYAYLTELNKGEMNVVSRTLKDDKWIVAYQKDDAPISYYKYDRENKKADFLFVHNSKLSNLDLNPMIPVVIKARDGVDLVSYLSVPKKQLLDMHELKLKEPLSLILSVHGGPQARDNWGYNSVDQWLTNRGFAVLSVNYRGSTGFGKKFIRLGDGQWATKMHDDLIDAVNWAIEKGITTKDNVGIYGGSYGGYATLVGLTMTPDIFKCGVDIVGPSNLKTLYDSIPPYWAPFKDDLKRKFGGDPDTPEGLEIINKKSPINYIDKITKPLLIAQGANDPRVKQAESDQIVNAMVDKGIPVTYLLYPDEGHGFAKPENRTAFYAVTEQFLGKCFNIPTEEIGNDADNSSIQILHGENFLELE